MIFSAVFHQVSLEGHQTIYMSWILFICKGSTSYIESINQSESPKKNICWYGTQKLTKNLNIYISNYQTETAIFLATKQKKKNSYGMHLLKFFHTEYIKTAKDGGFCEESLSFCCYEYGANASEAVQKISTRALLELCQITKTANFKATPMKKQFISRLLPALLEIQTRFFFFLLKNKNE